MAPVSRQSRERFLRNDEPFGTYAQRITVAAYIAVNEIFDDLIVIIFCGFAMVMLIGTDFLAARGDLGFFLAPKPPVLTVQVITLVTP